MLRSNHVKALVIGLALLGGAVIGRSQTVAIPLDATWRYTNIRTNLGTAWREVAYDDNQSNWDGGPALLGIETSVPFPYPVQMRTPLVLTNTTGGEGALTPPKQTVTYYFRTHFNFDADPFGASLVVNGYVDDGATFYLNGKEAARIRMPTTALTYTTLASSTPALVEGVVDTFNLPYTNLVRGDNLLAVEVHQITETSSDIVFGLVLNTEPGAPIVIKNQPDDLNVTIGSAFILGVDTSGTDPKYQWYKNGAKVPTGGTSSTFTNLNSQSIHSGGYSVVISNAFGSVTSSIANVLVLPDTSGPLLVDATMTRSNQVTINFSENLLKTPALDTNNYLLTSGNSVIAITNAAHNLKVVTLTLGQNLVVSPNWNYILTVNNLRDSPNTNIIAPNSWIGVSYLIISNIFNFTEPLWRYDSQETDNSLGTGWTAPNYDDNPNKPPFHWTESGGPFGFDQTAGFPPACAGGINNILGFGANTYYYRTKFVAATNYTNVVLRIGQFIDDGAVFYLDGVEIFRVGMPVGAVVYTTVANRLVGNAGCVTNNVTLASLVKGSHTLAVEVHQNTYPIDSETDTAFAASLTLAIPVTAKLPVEAAPKLNVARQAADQVSLKWSGVHGYALEGAKTLSGLWLQVANMQTNTIVNPTNAVQFFRLHKVN